MSSTLFISSDIFFFVYKIGHRALQHTHTSSIQDCKLYFFEKFVRDSKSYYELHIRDVHPVAEL